MLVDYFEYKHKTHFTPISEPDLNGKELEYLVDAFSSTWISSRGAYIDRFEKDFSTYCSTNYGVSTSNGTVAIHLALKALGVGEGDEVIVPDLTFAATINAVLHANATPVIVDVKEDDWTIDCNEIKKALTDKTKAIIPVHIYGQPCDMDQIMTLAKEHNLYVIEDCAEAHGAEFKGGKVGSFGDISTFSFFANKIITTGEGGMCVTNNEKLNQKMRMLRDHGMNPKRKYWHDELGYNYRMTNLQAAIGCAQLERITEIHELNSTTENSYRKTINNKELIKWQINLENKNKVTWLICGLVPQNRDKIIERLRKKGIDSRPFFYSLGDMPLYKPYLFSNKVSKKISERGLNLPVKIQDSIEDKLNIIKKTLSENIH
ncbi:MAG: aminotransferase DegT [Flavobacteriales bacterium]|nr:MAG: aminotransferase DegT [Flavobacteriales bacterium]